MSAFDGLRNADCLPPRRRTRWPCRIVWALIGLALGVALRGMA